MLFTEYFNKLKKQDSKTLMGLESLISSSSPDEDIILCRHKNESISDGLSIMKISSKDFVSKVKSDIIDDPSIVEAMLVQELLNLENAEVFMIKGSNHG